MLIKVSNAEINHPIVAKKEATIKICVDYISLKSTTEVPTFPKKDTK